MQKCAAGAKFFRFLGVHTQSFFVLNTILKDFLKTSNGNMENVDQNPKFLGTVLQFPELFLKILGLFLKKNTLNQIIKRTRWFLLVGRYLSVATSRASHSSRRSGRQQAFRWGSLLKKMHSVPEGHWVRLSGERSGPFMNYPCLFCNIPDSDK